MNSGGIAAQYRDALSVRIDHRRGNAKTLPGAGSKRGAHRFIGERGGNAMRRQHLGRANRRLSFKRHSPPSLAPLLICARLCPGKIAG